MNVLHFYLVPVHWTRTTKFASTLGLLVHDVEISGTKRATYI
jgi:hypothetical protein